MNIQFNCPVSLSDLSKNHCDLCQHKVIDCTAKSDAEIHVLASKSEKFCGIFKSSQIKNANQSFNQTLFKLAFVFVFVLGLNETKAATFMQQDVEIDYTISKTTTPSDTLQNSPIIQGVITDESGESMPFVKVMVETTAGICFYTLTDFDGAYKISLKDIPVGTLVSVSARFIGVQPVVITNVKLDFTTVVNITMQQEQEILSIGLIFTPEHNLIPSDPYDFGKQKVVIQERR